MSSGSISVVISLSLGTFLALLLPDNPLTRSRLASSFAEVMSSVIPSIDHVAAMSGFPEATRFFFSVMWLLLPLQVVLLTATKGLVDVPKMLENLAKVTTSRLMANLAFLFLFVGILVVALFLMGGDQSDASGGMTHEIAYRLMSNSRFWMGLLGSAYLLVVAFALSAVVKWVGYQVSK